LSEVNDLRPRHRRVIPHAVVVLRRDIPDTSRPGEVVGVVRFVVDVLRGEFPTTPVREHHDAGPLELVLVLSYRNGVKNVVLCYQLVDVAQDKNVGIQED
jgi:hypothetical protein